MSLSVHAENMEYASAASELHCMTTCQTSAIHSRIEAWFKSAEVNVAVDQETVEDFARQFGDNVSAGPTASLIPEADREEMQIRLSRLQELVSGHMNMEELMRPTDREQMRVRRARAREINKEVDPAHQNLVEAVSRAFRGDDAHQIEAPLKALVEKLNWLRTNLSEDIREHFAWSQYDDVMQRARSELERHGTSAKDHGDAKTAGELAQEELVKTQAEKKAKKKRAIEEDAKQRQANEERLRRAKEDEHRRRIEKGIQRNRKDCQRQRSRKKGC